MNNKYSNKVHYYINRMLARDEKEDITDVQNETVQNENFEFVSFNEFLKNNHLPRGLMSNGDDYIGYSFIHKSNDMSQIPTIYLKYFGMKMDLFKSLAGQIDGEVNREQIRAGFSISHKGSENISPGKYVVLTKPMGHTLSTFLFTEDFPIRSLLIQEIGRVAKTMSQNYHPNLSMVIDKFIELSRFGLFTRQFQYVPVYLRKAWVENGKPSNGYHMKITNLVQAMKIAGKEAAFLKYGEVSESSDDNMRALRDQLPISFTDKENGLDIESYFYQSRVYRMIEAKRIGNNKLVKDIQSEVVEANQSYFRKLNQLSNDDVDNSDGDGEFTEVECRRLNDI